MVTSTILLIASLLKSEKACDGKVVILQREDVVLLMPEQYSILIYKIRYPHEVRNVADVPDVKAVAVEDAQLNLADTLINSMDKPFGDAKLEDKYRDIVMSMVQEKVSGKQTISIETN